MLALALLIGRFLLGFGTILKLAATAAFFGFLALPNWVKIAALVALLLVVVYLKGSHDGAAGVQTKWDAANAQAISNAHAAGSQANASAQASVPPLTPAEQASDAAVVPRVQPCRVPDIYDRSCAGR